VYLAARFSRTRRWPVRERVSLIRAIEAAN
jgi:hypothetical protein